MGDTKDKGTDKAVAAAVARQKEMVAQQVEQHKDEDVNLEEVSGGWSISYTTDPNSPQ